MKIHYFIITATFALFFGGCATAYQKTGFSGGYSDSLLQDDIYQVSFRGNGYTSRERANDFALLRSAEVTINMGFNYFIILNGSEYTHQSSYTTPMSSQTQGSAYVSGNYASYHGTTNYYGGQTYLINKPTAQFTIQTFKEKPSITEKMYFDAQQIYTNLRKKYNLVKDE